MVGVIQPTSTCVGHFRFYHLRLSHPTRGTGYVVIKRTCPQPLISSVAQSVGDSQGVMAYVASRPVCGPALILSPRLKCRHSQAAGVM